MHHKFSNKIFQNVESVIFCKNIQCSKSQQIYVNLGKLNQINKDIIRFLNSVKK